MSAKRREAGPKVVDPDQVAKALAKAVFTGNVVDFRFLFVPFSPAREDSTERFDTIKYSYLLPDGEMERDPEFQEILGRVRDDETWRHVQTELEANRPAQLPSDLLLMLADNAVRQGKYTSAAQAYELLRIRSRMQDEFYAAADRALDENDVARAVRGYRAATGLAYDYAAFPEPLPEVPDYQTRALLLHGEYPTRPDDCVALKPLEEFLRTALAYLLLSPEAAARFEAKPVETRVAVLLELVRQQDPTWDEFARRYREARKEARPIIDRFMQGLPEASTSDLALEGKEDDPRRAAATLLGREIPEGEWWQYLKELAYEHPAAALFVCRRLQGDVEVLIPVCSTDSPVTRGLGLENGA